MRDRCVNQKYGYRDEFSYYIHFMKESWEILMFSLWKS